MLYKKLLVGAFIIFLIIIGLVAPLQGQVRLPALVTDSMVLQRDAKVNIWGWATPKEKVTVLFLNKQYKTVTGANGKWQVVLAPSKAGGPFTMTITASNKITLANILMGDVWFCSGQSNMVHQMNIHDVTYASEIATANYPHIRQYLVPTLTSLTGAQTELPKGSWQPAVGEAVRPFSAVAYFFAKKLYDQYKVPIGIINSSVGGTPIEAWTSEEGLQPFTPVIQTVAKNKDTAIIYTNNRKVAAAAALRNARPVADKGLTESSKWFEVSYQPKHWRNISIPGYWEDQGIRNLDGVVWYRREIEVPATMAGKPAKLFMGRITDADEVYINGKKVGTTTYKYPQRRYTVMPGLLKAGKNLIVIRVTNNGDKGGFMPDKPYYLFAGADTVGLTGYWQYRVGEVFAPQSGTMATISLQNQPTALYNAMVAPLVNYTIKGFVWYQGESNGGRPGNYAALQKALIADWRSKWQQGNLPFLLVQLPNYLDVNYLPEESNWALLREAQTKALEVPNTGVAIAIDLGEWNDVHPENKKTVGDRLALAAQKIAYGEEVVYSGPLYNDATVQGSQIVISFSNTGSGLTTNDSEPLSQFAIAGADKKFVWAQAEIQGDKVVVHSAEVPQPMYVRYAWADNPFNPNLYNKEGLPAAPFRTDQ